MHQRWHRTLTCLCLLLLSTATAFAQAPQSAAPAAAPAPQDAQIGPPPSPFQTLYSFGTRPDGSDGAFPRGPLVMDAEGNLYGATRNGGEPSWVGVIFQLKPNHDRTAWTQKVLYSFCSQPNCADGRYPNGGLA